MLMGVYPFDDPKHPDNMRKTLEVGWRMLWSFCRSPLRQFEPVCGCNECVCLSVCLCVLLPVFLSVFAVLLPLFCPFACDVLLCLQHIVADWQTDRQTDGLGTPSIGQGPRQKNAARTLSDSCPGRGVPRRSWRAATNYRRRCRPI
jgi:hypothetical protein